MGRGEVRQRISRRMDLDQSRWSIILSTWSQTNRFVPVLHGLFAEYLDRCLLTAVK